MEEDKGDVMKFKAAMEVLAEGYKVRCRDWKSGWYVDINTGENHHLFTAWKKSIESEWELYEEPTKKRHRCGHDPHLTQFPNTLFCYEDNYRDLFLKSEAYSWKVSYCPFCGYNPEEK